MADKMELEQLDYSDELKGQSSAVAGSSLAQSTVALNPAAAAFSEQKTESVTNSVTTAAVDADSVANKEVKKTSRWGRKAKAPATDDAAAPEEPKQAVSYLTLYRFATKTDKFYIAYV